MKARKGSGTGSLSIVIEVPDVQSLGIYRIHVSSHRVMIGIEWSNEETETRVPTLLRLHQTSCDPHQQNNVMSFPPSSPPPIIPWLQIFGAEREKKGRE